MRRLTLDFNDRTYAFRFHMDTLKMKGSYIACLIILRSEDLVIDEITEEYITFIYNDKKYCVKKQYVSNIKYEKVEENK